MGLQLEFLRKRYHKDILSSPVLMLNFCPDLLCEPLELQKVTREVLFLVDRSGSMSGTNIQSVKVSCNKDKTTNRFLDSGIMIIVDLFLFVPCRFCRKPCWWHWRVSLLAPCWTLWASAPLSSLFSAPASSALMLVWQDELVQNSERLNLSCL